VRVQLQAFYQTTVSEARATPAAFTVDYYDWCFSWFFCVPSKPTKCNTVGHLISTLFLNCKYNVKFGGT
jgi:hypothetical protein